MKEGEKKCFIIITLCLFRKHLKYVYIYTFKHCSNRLLIFLLFFFWYYSNKPNILI